MQLDVSKVLLVVANLLIPISLLSFATGFFPYKPFLPGKASFDDGAINHVVPPMFDKVIFMVVDALRSDFVYSHNSGFKYTQSLIRSGVALPFTAHATAPTITMPRIKAITTGSIPSFLDVILNFAESDRSSSLVDQDNWLSQLKAKQEGSLVMYGDDTWLKLFPGLFSRADGTSSFFVSDFTEVDDNVTRHIPWELMQDDWNGMVLHYLGLDHIGHKSGPKSPHMIAKQLEMDDVVKLMFKAIETEERFRSTLLVLCGDHGMNDVGNHGGSAQSETSPALVFLAPKFQTISNGTECPITLAEGNFHYYNTVEQSDIAPTLAGLLAFPVPLNNLGVFIPDFLTLWSEQDQISIMLQNARQIRKIVKENSASSFDTEGEARSGCEPPETEGGLSCMWSQVSNISEAGSDACAVDTLHSLTKFLKHAQKIMSNAASEYDLSRLHFSIGIAALANIVALAACATWITEANLSLLWFSSLAFLYGIMMFASSYVEEEHHFWYWIASSWCGWLFLKGRNAGRHENFANDVSPPILLLVTRVARSWNQTGQKHAGDLDIARSVFPSHTFTFWLLVTIAYLDSARRLSRCRLPRIPGKVSSSIFLTLCLAALRFKTAFTNADAPELCIGLPRFFVSLVENTPLVAQCRVVFLGISTTLSSAVFAKFYIKLVRRKNGIHVSPLTHELLTLFLMTQSRSTNVPIFLLFGIFLNFLGSCSLSVIETTLTCLIFQYASFFVFGGSNAISSIDLSSSYNGVDKYNVTTVALLTFCGNWAGPLWWTSATNLLLLEQHRRGQRKILFRHLSLLTAFNAASMIAVMLACTALRTHLFIWTVFSPKYLYSMAWSIGQHVCVNVAIGSLLFWFETW